MPPSQIIGRAVRMVCLQCGNEGERPVEHMKSRYGATCLRDVRLRARCLRYIGGVRCGGPARVSLVPIYEKSGFGVG